MPACAAGYLEDSYNPYVCERKWVWRRWYILGQSMVIMSFHAISTMEKGRACFIRSNTWIVIWTKKWGTFCWIGIRRNGAWLQSLQIDLFSSSVPVQQAGSVLPQWHEGVLCATGLLSWLVGGLRASTALCGDLGPQWGTGHGAWQKVISQQGCNGEPGVCIS